jgi:SAM-dependent methyltransferase
LTTSRPITNCQLCDERDLSSLLFLGYVPPVNTMPPVGEVLTESVTYPLELLRCANCTMVQLGLEVDPDVLFPPSYPYRSRSTGILRRNFAELAQRCSELLDLSASDLVVDIGSNDGTLLTNFQERGLRVLGVEPSLAAKDANDAGIPTRMEFFGPEAAAAIAVEVGRAKIVTAANVFAHIPDPVAITRAVESLLAEDGVFISESHYLPSLVETLQYDTIYHEHLRYYALGSLSELLRRAGLQPFRVERIPTHGGSIRVFASRPGVRAADDTVTATLGEEERAGVTSGRALESFRIQVAQSKLDLASLLAPLRQQGARIFGVGAPSRASTLINYTGLDETTLECVVEISTSGKLGKYMPGTRVPVVDEELLFSQQPDYALLLSWHISDELVANLRRKGYRGRFIVPLPQPAIIDG